MSFSSKILTAVPASVTSFSHFFSSLQEIVLQELFFAILKFLLHQTPTSDVSLLAAKFACSSFYSFHFCFIWAPFFLLLLSSWWDIQLSAYGKKNFSEVCNPIGLTLNRLIWWIIHVRLIKKKTNVPMVWRGSLSLR